MAESIIKGIVLEVSNYPENDNESLIKLLTKKGILNLIASGLNKAQSKNKANLLPGSYTEIEYFKARLRGKFSRLKKANALIVPDYDNRHNIVLITKLLRFFNNFESSYNPIVQAYLTILPYMGQGKNRWLLTYVLGQSLDYFGAKIVNDKCVECLTPGNLCDFQFYKGGFLCAAHMTKRRWTKELKSYYYLFHSVDVYMQMANSEIDEQIRHELIDFLKENGSSRLDGM